MPPLTSDTRLLLIEKVAAHESAGGFSALNRDGEFRGLFNRGERHHPAFQTFHIGLSFGIVQFTQDSGTLGQLLVRMRRRDSGAFAEIFGPEESELIEVTTADGPRSRERPPRGTRVQPVAGADLWEEPWLGRFRRAGDHRPFQLDQLELADESYLEPMLRFCNWMGLTTDRALAIVFDRAVQLGRGGTREWVMKTVGPIAEDDTESLQHALEEYGFSDLRAFQEDVGGLKPDGKWGPNTHAAMCWFERNRPPDAPFVLAVPDPEMILDMLVAESADKRWGHRVARLRRDPDFNDQPLSFHI